MSEISVIIPVYNRPKLLRQAVESVFAQTFTDWELIIINDGSTDETADVAASLADSADASGRCRVLNIHRLGFPGAARNRGIEAAGGTYLAFLDSDDLWKPNKLELQLSFMKRSGFPLTHTREIWSREERIVSQKGQKHKREGDIFNDALRKCIIGPSTVMIERSFCVETGGFHERLEIAEDYEYWLRITSEYKVGYLDEELTVKRAGKWDQLSEKYGKIEWFRLAALACLLNIELPGSGLIAEYPGGYRWKGFGPERLKHALDEFRFKCGVWASGCRKRGRLEEAEAVEELITNL